VQQPGSPRLSRKPRVWLSSSPDGARIFFLARDANEINQVYSVPGKGGPLRKITSHEADVVSTVDVHPSGGKISYICDGSVFVTHLDDLAAERVTVKGSYSPQNVKWSHGGDALLFESRSAQDEPVQLFVLNPVPSGDSHDDK